MNLHWVGGLVMDWQFGDGLTSDWRLVDRLVD